MRIIEQMFSIEDMICSKISEFYYASDFLSTDVENKTLNIQFGISPKKALIKFNDDSTVVVFPEQEEKKKIFNLNQAYDILHYIFETIFSATYFITYQYQAKVTHDNKTFDWESNEFVVSVVSLKEAVKFYASLKEKKDIKTVNFMESYPTEPLKKGFKK